MKMILGGKKVDAADGKTLDVINPATLKVVDTVPAATPEDVDLAIRNAQEGFREWSAVPMCERTNIIEKFRELLLKNQEKIAQTIMQELGKPINNARGEVMYTAGNIKAMVEGARLLNSEAYNPGARAGAERDLILTVREPLGIIVAVVPFNFPVSIMTNKVLPALLMGNAVIVKPSSETPLSDILYTELLIESGVPANAIQVITGSGSKIGDLLTGDPRIAAVTLTGSTEAGIKIAKSSAPHMHHLIFELGGNDAVIILKDADLDLAVSEAVNNRLFNCGQVCNSTKRYVVHNSIREKFEQMLVAELKTKVVGDPTREDVDAGPLVSKRAAEQVEEYVNRTVAQGAKVLCGGKRFNETYFEPTVLDAPRTVDAAKSLEIFGPVWTVIGFDDVDEAISIANDSIYGLNSAVIGTDVKELLRVAKQMQAGTCVINGASSYSGPDSPFGGYKQSGKGREGSLYSLREVSQVKTIVFKNMY